MCKHRISIFFAEILHGTLEYESTQTVKVPEGSESEGGKWITLILNAKATDLKEEELKLLGTLLKN